MAKQPQGSPNFDVLPEAQIRAALLIAQGKTGRATAAELGIHESTLSEWRQTPQFRASVNSVLADIREATCHRLGHAAAIALDTLEEVMQSKTASDRDRLAAAAQVLAMTLPQPTSIGPTTRRAVLEADDMQAQEEKLWASLI